MAADSGGGVESPTKKMKLEEVQPPILTLPAMFGRSILSSSHIKDLNIKFRYYILYFLAFEG